MWVWVIPLKAWLLLTRKPNSNAQSIEMYNHKAIVSQNAYETSFFEVSYLPVFITKFMIMAHPLHTVTVNINDVGAYFNLLQAISETFA